MINPNTPEERALLIEALLVARKYVMCPECHAYTGEGEPHMETCKYWPVEQVSSAYDRMVKRI